MTTVYDERGRRIVLGNELGRGAEGAVFEAPSMPNHVVKIYFRRLDQEHQDKIRAAIRLNSPEISSVAAWPISAVAAQQSGQISGFVMPRVSGFREVHELSAPAHRKSSFPKADWRFLIATALNLSIAVQRLHARGVVIGDVNQKNIMVNHQALVRLVDCDSYQISDGGKVYRCRVGVGEFTPPELQSSKFEDVNRLANHDLFGLAVTIFQLLMMGRHPFAGRFFGNGDMPIPKAISEYRFAFSANGQQFQMSPPPHSLLLSDLGGPVSALFEKAFSKSASAQGNRPRADDWISALDILGRSLRTCINDPGHFHLAGKACHWCRIEAGNGPYFFVTVTLATVPQQGNAFDLSKVWLEISQIVFPAISFQGSSNSNPGLNGLAPAPLPKTSDDTLWFRRVTGATCLVSSAVTLFGCLLPPVALFTIPLVIIFGCWHLVLRFFFRPHQDEQRRRTQVWNDCVADYEKFKRDTEAFLARFRQEFFERKRDLEKAKKDLESVKERCRQDLLKLKDSAREEQLKEFLESQFISSARISGIGPGRVTMLEAHGIETAYDVSNASVGRVPGFGPTLTTNLVVWRTMCEARFVFDPKKGIPVQRLQQLRLLYVSKERSLERTLVAGPASLKGVIQKARSHVETIRIRCLDYEKRIAQAFVDKQLADKAVSGK